MTGADWVQLAGQLVVLTGIVLGYLGSRKRQSTIKADVARVEHAVNSRSDRQDARADQLVAALTASGIAVPPTPAQTAADEKLGGPC